ncbi:MAG: hypothetical protein ACLTPN_00750 [Clostridia bacterium]|jgi:hypothetical protein
MLILGNWIINLNTYLLVGIFASILLMIYFIYVDIKDERIIILSSIIRDIGEGLIIGMSWIISIPILVITNLIISVMVCLFYGGDDYEE